MDLTIGRPENVAWTCDQEEKIYMDECYSLFGKYLSPLDPMSFKGLVTTSWLGSNYIVLYIQFWALPSQNTSFYQGSVCNNEQRLQIADRTTYRIRSFLGPRVLLAQKQLYIRVPFQIFRPFNAIICHILAIVGFYPKFKSFCSPFPAKLSCKPHFIQLIIPLSLSLQKLFRMPSGMHVQV